MKNPFNQVQTNNPNKNRFDLSHERKQTQQMGDLAPFLLQEVVPGDQFQVNTEILVRFSPLLAPLMHRVDVHLHYFYVPNRIVWSEWKDFITGGEDGTDLPSFPRLTLTSNVHTNHTKKGKLADYLGVPPSPASNTSVEFSGLPFRAYQMIYNEYYRDQNHTAEIDYSDGSGIINTTAEEDKIMTMRKRAWEKDYFTSALPWTQRGAESTIPLGQITTGGFTDTAKQFPTATGISGLVLEEDGATSDTGILKMDDSTLNLQTAYLDTDSTSINDLRYALRLQRWLETSARAGSRYIEQINAHYGVRVKDYRLQRPEFLGGGKTPVQVSEVLATYQNTNNTTNPNDVPIGDLSGHAISFGEQNGFSTFIPEHGYIIGLCSIIPRSSYQDGLHRTWNKFDKFDYYFPEFAHLGEQAVLNKEVYFSANLTNNEATFGYQQRFAEYKYQGSTVHGDFRDDFDHWHLSRKFGVVPTLNTSFIECDPDQRIFAVTDTSVHKCWISLYNKVSALRPMPYFSVPHV